MLRRRSKSPRQDKHAPRTPQGQPSAPRSRRRARPDAPVPAELLLPSGGLPAIARDRPKTERRAPKPPREEPWREEPPRPRTPAPRKSDGERVVLVTGFDPF